MPNQIPNGYYVSTFQTIDFERCTVKKAFWCAASSAALAAFKSLRDMDVFNDKSFLARVCTICPLRNKVSSNYN